MSNAGLAMWMLSAVAACGLVVGQGCGNAERASARRAGPAVPIRALDLVDEARNLGLGPASGGSAARASKHPARVALPLRASGPFRVTDVHSGMFIEASLDGAAGVSATLANGYTVYPAAQANGPGTICQVSAEGMEDYLVFRRAPAEPVIRYRVAFGKQVAGLRLVENTLELLDAGGAPRLRVAPPYLIDHRGRRIAAVLGIENCRVDRNPAPPWGRGVTRPLADECSVRVSWNADSVEYPAMLDPSWSTTGSASGWYISHTASLLADGRVLVAGGRGPASGDPWASPPSGFKSAELYDPVTGTWAVTGSMAAGRDSHTASVLADGRVLVAGGENAGVALASAEIYDPGPGTWSTTGSLAQMRWGHTASVLQDGRVLVVAGDVYVGDMPLMSAELYDPATGTWMATGWLAAPRKYHTASVLPDGSVLVAGGFAEYYSGPGVTWKPYPQTAELYNVGTGTWSLTGTMAHARSGHMAGVLPDGRVLVAGGSNDTDGLLDSTEIYDPGTGKWSAAAPLGTAREGAQSCVLTDGSILVAGGSNFTLGGALSSAELYDPTSAAWSSAGAMSGTHSGHSLTALLDGRALAAGGDGTAEIFDTKTPVGSACAQADECATGYCVDGVCCDTACGGGATDDCQACSTASGASTSGVCGAIADGASCQGGTCQGGTCVSAGAGGSGGTAGTSAGGSGGSAGASAGGSGGSAGTSAGGSGGSAGTSAGSSGGSAGTSAGGSGGTAAAGGGGGTAGQQGSAGSSGAIGDPAAGNGASGSDTSGDGSCGCHVLGRSQTSGSGFVLLLGGIALALVRRRRKEAVPRRRDR